MCFSFYTSDSFRPSGSILGNGLEWVKTTLINLSLCFHFLKKLKSYFWENVVLNSATCWKKTQQPGISATESVEKNERIRGKLKDE